MTPTPEQLAKGVVYYLNEQISHATSPREQGLKDDLGRETADGHWSRVAELATELDEHGQRKEQLFNSAAAYLAALTAFADLDIPPYEEKLPAGKEASREEDGKVALRVIERRGGRVSKFGEASRFKVLGAIVDLGGRLDKEMAIELLGSDSDEAVARVTSVAAGFRDKFRSIIEEEGKESMTIGELIETASEKGRITDSRLKEVYSRLVEKFGDWEASKFIDEILTARKGKKRAKKSTEKPVERPAVELDVVCEKVLASYLLREGVISKIESVLDLGSLESLAVKSRIIGTDDSLVERLEESRSLTPRGKIENKECERIKKIALEVFVEGRKVEEVSDAQIACRLLVEVARRTAGKPTITQSVLDAIFPSVKFIIQPDGLVESHR